MLLVINCHDLAQMCREHLPWWLSIFLYVLAEAAVSGSVLLCEGGRTDGCMYRLLLRILLRYRRHHLLSPRHAPHSIHTNLSQVIGTAITINLLIPQIPLVAGCAISIVDVLLILIFYRPAGSLRGPRTLEFFVMALLLAVVICFCIQLSLIRSTAVGTVFRGYLPSKQVVESQAYVPLSPTMQHHVHRSTPTNHHQHLPSLRNLRRDSHAALRLPRLRHRPTAPLRVRRQTQPLHSPSPFLIHDLGLQ